MGEKRILTMKSRASVTAIGLMAAAVRPTSGFQSLRSIQRYSRNTWSARHVPKSRSLSSTPCDVSEVSTPDLASMKGFASVLRESKLSNVKGEEVRLGDYMGDNVSVVVFLRHLA